MVINCPFSTIGVDYLGHLFVRDYPSNDNYKVWICLLTCASTRAIHLEVVTNNTAETFILAFRRFMGRRGVPQKVYSDNAGNFVSADTQDFVKSISQFALNNSIDWTFNPPASPWWGGFYERMVQLVKRCLRKVLLKSYVTLDELSTVVIEVEAILNDRPLTALYEELTEEVITPNHLIHGRRLVVNPSGSNSEEQSLEIRYKYVNTLMNHFWSRFNKEYLNELRERQVAVNRRQSRIHAKVNDVVLIKSDKLPRSKWSLGVIEKLVASDDAVRTALVRTRSNGRNIVLRRPVNLLFPVEN